MRTTKTQGTPHRDAQPQKTRAIDRAMVYHEARSAPANKGKRKRPGSNQSHQQLTPRLWHAWLRSEFLLHTSWRCDRARA
jgi:hypothetical protein